MNKRAILFIHGFAGGIYDFNELINDLELSGLFDTYCFTMKRHGNLVINKIKKDDWINDSEYEIKKLINHGYKDIYIIGHSMGGVISSYLASKYKEIKKIVLSSPAFEFCNFKNNKINFIDSIKLIPNIFKNYTIREMLAKYFKVPLKTVKEFSYLVNDHYNDIKNVNTPTLLLYGNEDTTVPISSINYVYNNIKSKNIELYIIKGIKHNMFNNHRYEEIKSIIFNFLVKEKSNIKNKYFI